MSEPRKGRFPWYEVVGSTNKSKLEQGDFFDDFPVITPPLSSYINKQTPVELEAQYYDLIVISQSCDLVDLKDEAPIIFCCRYSYSQLTELEPNKYGKNQWGNYKAGRVANRHLLNRCEIKNHEFDYQIVDLRQVFNIPYLVVKDVIKQQKSRIRLLPPYREQLSQAFARQFMRVALPIDLSDKFEAKTGS